jgi:hypothetical protein
MSRELRDDKGQTCTACGEHFKYQYLYDDHWPCRTAGSVDPTTASITARSAEHDQLRRLLDAEKEQCSRMGVRNVQAMKILGGSYPNGIVERAQAVVDERDRFRAEGVRLRLQHDVAVSAAEAMTAAFERSRSKTERLQACIDKACKVLEASGDERLQLIAQTIREESKSVVPAEVAPTEMFVLMMDDADTSRSSDAPFGVAVTTEEEAKRFVREGGVEHSHSYVTVRVFADKDAGLRHAYPKHHESSWLLMKKESP